MIDSQKPEPATALDEQSLGHQPIPQSPNDTLPGSEFPLIVCSGLVKIFQVADLEIVALQGLDLEVAQGEILALVGPSGSGKSTLLNAIGGLDRPSAGKLEVGGQNLLKMSQVELTRYRREQVGFVWQQTARNLLPYLTARENIELLMRLSGHSGRECREWSSELLESVDMTEYAGQKPTQLSGGQQQRIAIACGLANRPKILLADEPTGEVDWTTAQRILTLLRDLREHYGITIVMVTHDPRVAEQADRVVAIRDGQTSSETIQVTALRDALSLTHRPSHSSAHTSSTPSPTVEELVVLDRAGRLQLPSDQRILAGIGRRARVELVEGGILIRPGDDDHPVAGNGRAESPSVLQESEGEGLYYSLYSDEALPQAGEKDSKRSKSFWTWWRRR